MFMDYQALLYHSPQKGLKKGRTNAYFIVKSALLPARDIFCGINVHEEEVERKYDL
jgi:hypothetical protein